MDKETLISIVNRYIDVPKSKKDIEYRQYDGYCEISFYWRYDDDCISNREYHITAKYMSFLGENKIEIESKAIGNSDRWIKVIKL
jgi:hypothetical protein